MPPTARGAALALAAVLGCAGPAGADAGVAVGVQPIFFVGRHYQTDNDVNGQAAGAFLEVTAHISAFAVHVESIPNFAAQATSSGEFGRLSQSIGVFTIDGRAFVGRTRRYYLSLGEAVLTQTTPADSILGDEITSSRVVGARFGAGARLSTAHSFVEAALTTAPRMRGRISFRLLDPTLYVHDRGERANLFDASLALGRRIGRFEYLAGLRNINYGANLTSGISADRNVAGGVFIEGRCLIGRR